MMTTIMRVFGAYDIPKLLNTPFCHLLHIYNMAERAVSLSQYDLVISSFAPNSSDILKRLQKTARDATIPDRDKMKELLSAENRRRAEEAWRRNSIARSNNA